MPLRNWIPIDTIDSAIVVRGHNHRHLVYNPYHRRIGHFQTNAYDHQTLRDELRRTGFPTESKALSKGLFLTLSTSDRCNLGCVYCFTGKKSGALASFEKVEAAIRDFFKRDDLPSMPYVSFFGSGDPFTNFPFIKESIRLSNELAADRGVTPRFLAQTSGAFSQRVLDFVIKHRIFLSVSVDGPPDVQYAQRPLLNGKPTSELVGKFVDGLVEAESPFQIRSTVTAATTPRMAEMVTYWANKGVGRLCLEPATLTGFGKDLPYIRPEIEEFAQHFLTATRQGQSAGINVDTESMGKLRNGADRHFCAAIDGRNVTLTTDGRRSFCVEELHPSSSGPLAQQVEATYEAGPVKGPLDDFAWPPASCETCFVKGACGSTCPKRALQTNAAFTSPYEWQCAVNRLLIPEGIGIIAEESDLPIAEDSSSPIHLAHKRAFSPTLWG